MESSKNVVADPCRLKINYAECVSCAACTSSCHTLALIMDSLTLELTERLCDNCSLCIRICPTGALYFFGDKQVATA